MPDLFARLHDGHLLGVHVDREERVVVLRCRSVDGRPVRIRMSGVVDLCVENVRLGNVILLTKVFESVEAIGPRMIAALAQTSDEEAIARYLRTLRARAFPTPRVFLLQGSYGADAACIFTDDIEAALVGPAPI